MNAHEFYKWSLQINDLTASQRQISVAFLRQEQQPAGIISSMLDVKPACPHCHHDLCVRWGNSHGLPRYRCKACHKTYNALTGTPLAHLRHRECWPEFAQCLIEGTTVRSAARRCGVHKTTSFRWRHRFLSLPAQDKPDHLHGIVEADETYFLESFKGQHHLERPPRRRGGVATKRGLSKEQVPVLIARDRSKVTTDAVLPKADTRSISAVLLPVIDQDAVLCSDGNAIYRCFARQAHIEHKPVNLSAGIRVLDHAYHVQNVNAYDSRLKGWMLRFHGVATKYLPNYLGWRRFLERFAESITPLRLLIHATYGAQHLMRT